MKEWIIYIAIVVCGFLMILIERMKPTCPKCGRKGRVVWGMDESDYVSACYRCNHKWHSN